MEYVKNGVKFGNTFGTLRQNPKSPPDTIVSGGMGMERGWKQLMAAFVLGAILPGLTLHIGRYRSYDSLGSVETVPMTEQQPTNGLETVHNIPVLLDSESIRVMKLESYILGVVLAEMPAAFEKEALKAQAVVARTYALRRLTLGDRHSGYAICTDSNCCQAYISEEKYLQTMGDPEDVEKIRKAVSETAGQVLTYGGALAEATYFSCSGGRTENAAAVWGGEIPYLQAVDSPGEENAPIYEKTVYFTKGEFSAALGRNLTGSPLKWLGKVTYTDGGGVDTMLIGGISYTGTQLRNLLGLNSTAFSMEADSAGITVITRGKGHRVGMSQYGADAMAVGGSSFEEILGYYYPGTEIDNFSEMG